MKKRRGRDRRGFTLVEVLCAFLVLALSAGLLCAGIGAAGSMNQAAISSQRAFYTELSTAEGQASPAAESTAGFHLVDTSGAISPDEYGSRAVELYREEAGALCSYALK